MVQTELRKSVLRERILLSMTMELALTRQDHGLLFALPSPDKPISPRWVDCKVGLRCMLCFEPILRARCRRPILSRLHRVRRRRQHHRVSMSVICAVFLFACHFDSFRLSHLQHAAAHGQHHHRNARSWCPEWKKSSERHRLCATNKKVRCLCSCS